MLLVGDRTVFDSAQQLALFDLDAVLELSRSASRTINSVLPMSDAYVICGPGDEPMGPRTDTSETHIAREKPEQFLRDIERTVALPEQVSAADTTLAVICTLSELRRRHCPRGLSQVLRTEQFAPSFRRVLRRKRRHSLPYVEHSCAEAGGKAT